MHQRKRVTTTDIKAKDTLNYIFSPAKTEMQWSSPLWPFLLQL